MPVRILCVLYIDNSTTRGVHDVGTLSSIADVETVGVDYRFRMGTIAENKAYLQNLSGETKKKLRAVNQDPNYFIDLSLNELVNRSLAGIDGVFIGGAYFDPQAIDCLDEPKDLDDDIRRDIFEKKLISTAALRRIPILAVCGGSWRLAAVYGAKTLSLLPEQSEQHSHFDEVRIMRDKVKLTPNTMLHAVHLDAQRNKLLKFKDSKPQKDLEYRLGANPKYSSDILDVNTAHWRVLLPPESMEGTEFNQLFCTSAIDTITETLEGYEAKHGAPIMAVQFHPEYAIPYEKHKNGVEKIKEDYKTHRSILEWLAVVGAEYKKSSQLKLRTHDELQAWHQIKNKDHAKPMRGPRLKAML